MNILLLIVCTIILTLVCIGAFKAFKDTFFWVVLIEIVGPILFWAALIVGAIVGFIYSLNKLIH